MITINCNVSGTPTDTPYLVVDTGLRVDGILATNRVSFSMPDDTPAWGMSVYWDHQTARSVVPPMPGSYEGSQMPMPLPTLTYETAPAVGALTIRADKFYLNETLWTWAGATDFALLKRIAAGEDIRPLLEQRASAGANLVRVLAMKANNTGWELIPGQTPDYWGKVRHLFDVLASRGLYCEFTVFADTAAIMPSMSQQQSMWADVQNVAAAYPHVLLELVNEAGHGTQAIDPARFNQPDRSLASHGSGLTDAHPVEPFWSFTTYHARREADGRGFTNYDAYEFERDYPKPCPFIPDEGIKPENYGYNTDYAYRMGQHAGINAGGTFHTGAGVNSTGWSPAEIRCAEAFFRGLRG